MSVYGWLSFAFNAVGLGSVLLGLYRRDPAAQRGWAAVRRRVRRWWRRLLGRPVEGRVGAEAAGAPAGALGAGWGRPPPPGPTADVEQRLAWLEDAVDLAFARLERERRWTTEELAGIRTDLADMGREVHRDVADLHRRLDEVSIPERLEWWGAAMVVVGLALSFVDALVSA